MTQTHKMKWERKDLRTVGFSISDFVKQIVKEQFSEYIEFFPLKTGYSTNSYSDGDFYCLQVKEINSQMPHVGELKDNNIIDLSRKVFEKNHFPTYEESFSILQKEGYSFDTHLYRTNRWI